MRSPFMRTLVAFGLLVGLGAWGYHILKNPPRPKEDKPKEKVFAKLERAKVKEITLSSLDQTIRLVRVGEGWKMTSPTEVAAAPNEVDAILSSLESLDIDTVAVESAPNLEDFGLASPKVVIAVLAEGASEPMKLALGDDVPGQSVLFAKLPSQPRIFTVASYVRGSFTKKPFDLRDRELLHVKRDEIKALAVEGPAESYALSRNANGEWALTKPLAAPAGRWPVDSLLGQLESLRMESVAAESAKDLKAFGLVRPTYTVTMDLGSGRQKTLAIGSKTADDKYYARETSAPLVAVVAKALADDLAKGMGELRAKRLLEVSAYEVDGCDVEADGAKKVLARSSTKDKEGLEIYKWKRTAPDTKDLDTNAVQDVLFKISGIEAAEFIDHPAELPAYGLDKPALKVTLRLGPVKQPVWFAIGQKGDGVYARRPSDGSVLKLDKAKADDLVKAFKGL